MIIYVDASALVKSYVAEEGSPAVERLLLEASRVGTSLVSRAEVSAAMARAARAGGLAEQEAAAAVRRFRSHWPDLLRIRLDETAVARADLLAWAHGLRGYDAVHLACALTWKESIGEDLVVATYDRDLWKAAKAEGLTPWPEGFAD
jgi:predicted nucleic acid-binding protein